jgi:hypothetical protein
MYATTNTTVASAAFTISYTVMTNYASCYALNLQTAGNARFSNSVFFSNAASDAVSISANGITYMNWRITNSYLETCNVISNYAISATSAITNAPIYNCVLVRNLHNVTPANGTASGSNTIVS